MAKSLSNTPDDAGFSGIERGPADQPFFNAAN
jgi:hypothetical protein